MLTKPKSVLIACPTFGLMPDPNQWLSTLLRVIDEFSMMGWKTNTFFPYRMPIANAENMIVNIAITNNCDYIFRMDDDIWGSQYGMVKKLVDADKEYISGAMFHGGFPYGRCAFYKSDKTKSLQEIYKNKLMTLNEVSGEGIQPCDLVATPFTLIKTTIFEKLLMPYYSQEEGIAIDSIFCQKLLDAGIQPYVHLDVQLNHRHVTPYNRHFLYNAEARALLKVGAIGRDTQLFSLLSQEFGEDGQKDLLMLKGVKIDESLNNVSK